MQKVISFWLLSVALRSDIIWFERHIDNYRKEWRMNKEWFRYPLCLLFGAGGIVIFRRKPRMVKITEVGNFDYRGVAR